MAPSKKTKSVSKSKTKVKKKATPPPKKGKVVSKAKKPQKAVVSKKKAKPALKSKVEKTKALKNSGKPKKNAAPPKAVLKPPGLKSKAKSPSVVSKKPATSKGVVWMQPLDDRILVEIANDETVSPGGLVLIDSTAQPENIKGQVIAVGRGHQTKKGKIHPIEVKRGDQVIFSKYAGDKVSVDGVNFVIIRESEILGLAST